MGILGAVVLPFPPPSLFALPSPPPPPSVDTAQRLRALGRGTSLGVRAAARRKLSSFFSPSSLDGRGTGGPAEGGRWSRLEAAIGDRKDRPRGAHDLDGGSARFRWAETRHDSATQPSETFRM